MSAQLQLVVVNQPPPKRARHHDAIELRQLASRLSGHVRSGYVGFAHAAVQNEALSPIEVGIVATWMFRSGLSESQILAVMARSPAPLRGIRRPSAKRKASADKS
jgi:hypothetical protein